MQDSGLDNSGGSGAKSCLKYFDRQNNAISSNACNLTESDDDDGDDVSPNHHLHQFDIFFNNSSAAGDCGGGGGSTPFSSVVPPTNSVAAVALVDNVTMPNKMPNKRMSSALSSCKTLQRKLEQKVERVRRNYGQQKNGNDRESTGDMAEGNRSSSTTLIPINRLKIPGQQEILPLVEYKSGHSDDDEDEISYYPTTSGVKHELSDTFSLQEMTIMGTDEDELSENGDDDDDSQTLEFLSPKFSSGRGIIGDGNGGNRVVRKLVKCFCCLNRI